MAGAMASASSGVINSIITKLTVFAEDEYGYGKLKGVRKEVLYLGDELNSMKALVEKLDDMDQLDGQAREWRNQVREMSYDIEDCIDSFMYSITGKNDGSRTGFVRKIVRFLKDLRVRYQIAAKIQEIKTVVNEVNERRIRYKLDGYVMPDSSYVHVDPRVVAIYAEADSLVGIDTPRDEVIKLLLMSGEQELRVASIVGFGGLGKTTLANQVYHKLKGKFCCGAFVSASQTPNVPRLLNQVLLELMGQSSPHINDLNNYLRSIREYLQDKRYFIVVDDIWDSSTWNIINCAFPKNKHGSRVLTTTRIYSVAVACCSYRKEYIYNMRPLDEGDSRRLFFSRIIDREACPEAFNDISADILKRCRGLPLAIISISSLLAGQSRATWEYVGKSLGSMFDVNSQLEDMKQILDLSYEHLPQHLKTCLLYLGIYPEDYTIAKNDLVRQWIAEGFVSTSHRLDANDVAESYFNELVNRSMLQPVMADFSHEVLSCRIHDMMLDLIRSKSAQEKFITVIDTPSAMTAMHKNIRRISIQYENEEHGMRLATINGSLSQVRSIAVFRRVYQASFMEFKYIRVLILKHLDAEDLSLTGMCELFLLTYLKIVLVFRCKNLELPSQIAKLRQLKTIDISGEHVERVTIPSELITLSQLEHLSVPLCSVLPNGIGKLTSLRTLENFDLARNPVDNIKGIGELTNMRDLKLEYSAIKWPMDEERRMDAMRSSLERLSHHSNLKSLDLWNSNLQFHALSTLSPSPRHLRRLHLHGCMFPRIPKWIAHLYNLYSLKLEVWEVLHKEDDDDVGILARLPSLIDLKLRVVECPKERVKIRGTTSAFQSLEHLQFSFPKLFLAFETGAMPRLRKLKLSFDVRLWSQQRNGVWLPFGIEHLPAGLMEIRLIINHFCFNKHDMDVAKSVLRNVFDARHPGTDLIFEGPEWIEFDWPSSDHDAYSYTEEAS